MIGDVCFRILKLSEFGIINALKSRWLKTKYPNTKIDRFYSPLTLDQISLVTGVYFIGLIMALFIVIVEKIVIWRKVRTKKTFFDGKYFE